MKAEWYYQKDSKLLHDTCFCTDHLSRASPPEAVLARQRNHRTGSRQIPITCRQRDTLSRPQ